MKPESFRTNCSAEAWICAAWPGIAIEQVLMLRHISLSSAPSSIKDERPVQNPTAWPILHELPGAFTLLAPANSEFPMTHVTYKIAK